VIIIFCSENLEERRYLGIWRRILVLNLNKGCKDLTWNELIKVIFCFAMSCERGE